MNVNRVRQLASQYLDYDMIRQYVELPAFPGYQIQLLLSFLHPDLQRQSRGELYALVTSLVQIGLDAHDHVNPGDRETDTRHMRSKQLNVLAGDYLSGKYYELLSHAEDIAAVDALSDAISDVNQLKMQHYMRQVQRDLSGDQYLEQRLAIRTRLFLAFEAHIPEEQRTLWRDLLDSGTICQILRLELEAMSGSLDHYEGWAVWELLHVLAGEQRERFLSAMDKPQQLHRWFVDHRLRERLEASLAHAVERFMQHSDDARTHTRYAEAAWPLLQEMQQFATRQYTYD